MYRPAGAYATPLPPWQQGWTQIDLLSVLYYRPRNKSADAFVAADNVGWSPVTGVEWYKWGGGCVPVNVVAWGPNPMPYKN